MYFIIGELCKAKNLLNSSPVACKQAFFFSGRQMLACIKTALIQLGDKKNIVLDFQENQLLLEWKEVSLNLSSIEFRHFSVFGELLNC